MVRIEDDVQNPVTTALTDVLTTVRESTTDGQVADYIPELMLADPDHFGISAAGVLGRIYHAGDCTARFTIQSVSKPFVYALALSDLGADGVGARVGVEPSGEPFNAISLDERGRPANPMINAGAIVTTSLVTGSDKDERFERIRAQLSRFAGRELELDTAVFESEKATGHRNRALAELTLAAGVLGSGVDDATEPYFKQCSLLVDTTDLALMGATLANGGVHPLTGDRVVEEWVARDTLSLMLTCGMYDRSGDWIFRVGMPAKSGVGGGIVAVTPGQFGIGVFSPRLDRAGNSSRGVAALRMLSQHFGLHLLDHPQLPASPIEGILVRDEGESIIVRLRGEVNFVAAEQIVHEAIETVRRPADGILTLDFTSVTRVDQMAARLLLATVAEARANSFEIAFDDPSGVMFAG